MIWGAMSASGRAGLWFMPSDTTITGQVYLNILKEKLQPFMDLHQTTVFQHDGAPSHKTKAVAQWLSDQGYQVLDPWPGNSPDLNIIEHVWYTMKRKVAEKNPSSSDEPKKKIKVVWVSEITQEYCKRLVHSMPDRIAAVLHNKGGPTKY